MPRVSVIFPMYNVAEYLKDSLTSVLDQTYRDFELIAVNDGATDSTMDVFRSVLSAADPDITIHLIEKENGGLADARNAALLKVSGEYVVFVDSDDVIHPRYLETLMADAEKYDSELSVSTFKMVNKDTLFDFDETVAGEPVEREELMKLLLSRRRFVTGCWCLLVKRSLITANDLCFNTSVKFSVDQAFIWKVIDLADRITINYSRLYHYYLRPGSIMTSTKQKDICSGVEHFTNVINSLEHLPFDSKILIDRWKFGILHSTAKLTDYQGYKEVREKNGIRYIDCLKIPVFSVRVLALLGVVSEKALYKFFLKR